MAVHAYKCRTGGLVARALLAIKGGLKFVGGHNASVFGTHCESDILEDRLTCASRLEVSADTACRVIGMLLDCLYRLRELCGRFGIDFRLERVVGGAAGGSGRAEKYEINMDVDPRCGLGVLKYWGRGDTLLRLVDPLRGEDLVEVDECLYFDKVLAECISRGGECGEIEVKWGNEWREWYYVKVCGTDVIAMPADPEEEDEEVAVVRVLDADSLSPCVVVDAARRLGASLQKLDMSVHCDFLRIHVAVRPGMGHYILTVPLEASKIEVASLETSALLYALACLAKAGLIEHRAK